MQALESAQKDAAATVTAELTRINAGMKAALADLASQKEALVSAFRMRAEADLASRRQEHEIAAERTREAASLQRAAEDIRRQLHGSTWAGGAPPTPAEKTLTSIVQNMFVDLTAVTAAGTSLTGTLRVRQELSGFACQVAVSGSYDSAGAVQLRGSGTSPSGNVSLQLLVSLGDRRLTGRLVGSWGAFGFDEICRLERR
jgi:hypothetical protein